MLNQILFLAIKTEKILESLQKLISDVIFVKTAQITLGNLHLEALCSNPDSAKLIFYEKTSAWK